MSDGIFFFVEKKHSHIVFWGKFTGDYRNVAIISTLFREQTKVEKEEFFIVFSTFDRDPEIIM